MRKFPQTLGRRGKFEVCKQRENKKLSRSDSSTLAIHVVSTHLNPFTVARSLSGLQKKTKLFLYEKCIELVEH